MAHLALTLLGQFQARLADQLLTSFESDKVRALLCYLAVEPAGVPHSRDSLAALLWPDYSDESARTNLRQTLYHLRKMLGDDQRAAANAPSFLLVTRQSIALNPAAPCQVDVRQMGALLAAAAAHKHNALAHCAECRQRLHQAVDLYQGEFLAGFTIADSHPFEEWRRITQEQWHGRVLAALTQLADAAEAVMDFTEAQRYAERQLQLEPWREEAHRQIMRALAHRGQRTAALAQYQRCCQILRAELDVEPDSETTALFQQIRTGALDKMTSDGSTELVEAKVASTSSVTESPPHSVTLSPRSAGSGSPLGVKPPAVTEPLHNLPASFTPFVGRASELDHLLLQLQQPACRLLTLVGPGGMGKTRLALEVARQCLPNYADGVFFVSLAPLTTVDGVAPTIAAALGLTLQGGDPQAALLKLLAPEQLLLILDNFEHLLTATGLVAALLQSAPQLQILVTSRARLNLQGEHFYIVQPLRFDAAMTLSAAANADAVRLFVQSVKRNQPDFLLDATNLPVVLRICRLVEGMPLGLEMAAAWVEMLSLPEIAEEIEKSADFLAVDWRNVPDRQRSMRAVFEWSWRLLTADEQQIFRKLSCFRGGFTRQAAEQVAGASLRVLTSLVHKSLVRRLETGAPSGARYEVHELVRQFAAEQLAATAGEGEAVATRHSAFYLAFIATHERRLVRAETREAMAAIQLEIDNIRQAWVWAVQQLDTAALSRSAWALRCFYDTMGLLSEGDEAFRRVVERLHAHLAAAADERQVDNRWSLGKFSALRANLLVAQGNYSRAIDMAQQASALCTAQETSEALALSHLSWGQALHRQGNFAEAQRHYEQTLQLIQAAQAQATPSELFYDVECTVQIWLGGLATERGLYPLAKEHIHHSLHLAQTLGKPRVAMTCLINLANLARGQGDYTAARRDYEQALRLAPQVIYRWGEAISHFELGDVVRLQGEYSLAEALLKRAFTTFHEIGARDLEAIAMSWLGRLYAYMGDYTQAEVWLTGDRHAEHSGMGRETEISQLQARAVLDLQRGEAGQALAYATQAWQLSQSFSSTAQAHTAVLLGHSQTRLRHFAAATTTYQQAIHLYTAIGRSDMVVEAQAGLADIAYQQGDWAQAQHWVAMVLPLLAEHPRAGQDEPFYLYLTCYQILAAIHDPRAASLLEQGHALLQQYADQITDDALRRSFWENVPLHSALHQAYMAEHHQSSTSTGAAGLLYQSACSRCVGVGR